MSPAALKEEKKRHDHLGKYQTQQFKGILALLVIFAHSNLGPFYGFGSWVVSVFFFLSGFALCFTTWGKKIAPRLIIYKYSNFLIPMVIVAVFYHILFHFFPTESDYNNIGYLIKSVIRFNPSVQSGWYIIALSLLFAVFFASHLLSKGDKKRFTVFLIILYILYTAYTLILDCGYACINTHNFILGCLFSLYREKIERFLRGQKVLGYIMLLFSYLVIAIPFLTYEKEGMGYQVLYLIFINTGVILFLYFSYNIKMGSRILMYLGKISLWVYLFHGGIQYYLMYCLPFSGINVNWTVGTFFLASAAAAIVLGSITDFIYGKTLRKLVIRLR